MRWRFPVLLTVVSVLAACGGSDENLIASDANQRAAIGGNGGQRDAPINAPEDSAGSPRFEITVVNLTAAQPFSPPAIILHGEAYRLFMEGQVASAGVESIAEGGDNAPLLASALADSAVYSTASGDAPIGPGASARVELSLPTSADLSASRLSLAMMLVNTNDAIGAARDLDLQALAPGESRSWDVASYDAGTEANDELASRIPGPAGSGPGTDPTRDDLIDAVLPHPGVLSSDDGLAGSALQEIHRWIDPVARVRVRRLQ